MNGRCFTSHHVNGADRLHLYDGASALYMVSVPGTDIILCDVGAGQEPVLRIGAGKANLPQLFQLAIRRHVHGFYEATPPQLSCNYTSAELTQFDGRARGDDVTGNLTVSYRRLRRFIKNRLQGKCPLN